MYAIFLYNIAICYIFVSYILRTIGKSDWILCSCETLAWRSNGSVYFFCLFSDYQVSEDEVVVSECDLQDISIMPLLNALQDISIIAMLDLSHNMLGNDI